MQFSDLELDPKVLKAVEESGYTDPTPIQAQAIPEALKGRDVLGIAQTGTGKTAGFVLPMITILAKGRARARMPRSLILCPTRELAAQVSENFEKYGKYHKLSMALLIGGVSFKDQDKKIDRGVDVLIATPGRLLDHHERGKLMLTGVQIMVVDEADRMLDMGFIPDIERIFKLTPFTRQTLFFSATMPPEITRLTQEFLHNPVRVEVSKQATAAETVTQGVCMFKPSRRDRETSAKEKRDFLRVLMTREGDNLRNAIIFCNRKTEVSILHKSLVKYGYNAGALHGDLDQSVRTATLNGFRDGSIKILVASDVAARGLDIPNVPHRARRARGHRADHRGAPGQEISRPDRGDAGQADRPDGCSRRNLGRHFGWSLGRSQHSGPRCRARSARETRAQAPAAAGGKARQ
jgi:superfamily II DNA/RNA helicase